MYPAPMSVSVYLLVTAEENEMKMDEGKIALKANKWGRWIDFVNDLF
jgi:hypothetical protein